MHTSRAAELVPGPAQRAGRAFGRPTKSPQIRARGGDPHRNPEKRKVGSSILPLTTHPEFRSLAHLPAETQEES
jgi:hypothetical protein